MTPAEFDTYLDGIIKANGVRAITGPVLNSVIKTLRSNVLFKSELPFETPAVITITNASLDVDNKYTFNHSLDCDDPVFVIRWVDNTYIEGDGYFNKERVDADNTMFTFTEDIPVGNVVITAFKFKAAE